VRLYTYPYSDDYSPPMPVVELGVGWPGSHQPAQTIVAVLDSGADGTLIPIDVLEAVRARYVGDAVIRGLTGGGQRVSVYLASLRVGPHVLHAVRVVAIPEGSESILGRNALQYLTVTLDGPAHSAEIRA
jgi:predicted aspartyl protease